MFIYMSYTTPTCVAEVVDRIHGCADLGVVVDSVQAVVAPCVVRGNAMPAHLAGCRHLRYRHIEVHLCT